MPLCFLFFFFFFLQTQPALIKITLPKMRARQLRKSGQRCATGECFCRAACKLLALSYDFLLEGCRLSQRKCASVCSRQCAYTRSSCSLFVPTSTKPHENLWNKEFCQHLSSLSFSLPCQSSSLCTACSFSSSAKKRLVINI